MSVGFEYSGEARDFDRRMGEGLAAGRAERPGSDDDPPLSHEMWPRLYLSPDWWQRATSNDSTARIERLLAELEMGKYGVAFSAGNRAVSAVVNALVEPRSTIVTDGATNRRNYELFWRLKQWGVNVLFCDMTSPEAVTLITQRQPRLVFVESVSSPYLFVPHLPRLMNAARAVKARFVVDNTVATACGCVPLEIARSCGLEGAAVVADLAQTYTGGFEGGVVVTDSDQLRFEILRIRDLEESAPLPHGAKDIAAGIATLSVRLWELTLRSSAIVNRMRHQLPDGVMLLHPRQYGSAQYDVAIAQLICGPGVVSFSCDLPDAAFQELVAGIGTMFHRSASFGSKHPTFTELEVPPSEELHQRLGHPVGGTPRLLRLSPGVGSVPAVIADRVADLFSSLMKRS